MLVGTPCAATQHESIAHTSMYSTWSLKWVESVNPWMDLRVTMVMLFNDNKWLCCSFIYLPFYLFIIILQCTPYKSIYYKTVYDVTQAVASYILSLLPPLMTLFSSVIDLISRCAVHHGFWKIDECVYTHTPHTHTHMLCVAHILCSLGVQ
jgi:hypothetical protein